MEFGLSEDQTLLDETVRGFLADQIPIDRIRALRDEDCPIDRSIWKSIAELGMTGVLVPEAQGGNDMSLLDASIVAQALGHAVTPTPFLSSSIIATVALKSIDHPKTADWLSGIASGEQIVGTAFMELFGRREEAGVSVASGKLNGKAMMALDACPADLILVAIDSSTLAMVRRDAKGVETTRLPTTDATRCTAEVVLKGVEPEAIFEDAAHAIDRAVDAGRIALAADTLGACESMIEQAVRYAGERKQFNRVIGSFQAVKHMCSEMIAELEPARSLLWYSAHTFDSMPDETPLMACHVLAHVSEIGREIASVSTQVHGGIGWTDEQNLHFWFKRIGVARHLLGGPEFLRARASALQSFDMAS